MGRKLASLCVHSYNRVLQGLCVHNMSICMKGGGRVEEEGGGGGGVGNRKQHYMYRAIVRHGITAKTSWLF